MKRLPYALAISIASLLVACSVMKTEPYVQNNTFYSPHSPELKVGINDDLKYIGKVEKEELREWSNTFGFGWHKFDSYLFGKIEQNEIVKGVLIRIYTTQGYWRSDIFDYLKQTIEKGKQNIGESSYDYAIFAGRRVFDNRENKILSDKGYKASNCYLTKAIGTIFGGDSDIKLVFMYMEDLTQPDAPSYGCTKWIEKQLWGADQKEFLKRFNGRSQSAFEIFE